MSGNEDIRCDIAPDGLALSHTPLSHRTLCAEVVMTNSTLVAPLRYSLTDVAKLLGLSRSTLYTRIAEGKLAIQKDGRRTFVSAVELARYLEAFEAPKDGAGGCL